MDTIAAFLFKLGASLSDCKLQASLFSFCLSKLSFMNSVVLSHRGLCNIKVVYSLYSIKFVLRICFASLFILIVVV